MCYALFVMLDEKSTVCVFVIESMTALGYGRNEREMIEQRERTEYSYRWHRHIQRKMSLPSYWQNVTIKMNKVCVCECGWGKNTGTDEEMRPKNRERAPKKRTRRKVNIRDSLLYETKIKSCKTHLTHIRLKRERASEREKSDAHTLEPNICSILLFYHLRRTNWFWNTHRNNNNDINGLAQLMMIEPFFGILLLPSATFYEALILLSSFSFRCKRSRQRYEPE